MPKSLSKGSGDTSPELVSRLAPRELHELIRRRGLDACGSLIAAATPQQVAAVLDLDLWRAPAAGGDERFDADRFGVWIESLMDEGESIAARVVAGMDPDLAVTGLSRFVRVFDPGIFTATESIDDEPRPELAPSGREQCDIGGFIVRANTPDAWDAIAGLLVALEEEYPDAFHVLMRGCRALSNSTPEADGLDDILLPPDQMVHDVSLAREGRRAGQGYVTPGDARAFLQLARQRRVEEPSERNPIAAAYLTSVGESAQDARTTELAFLANALLAGASVPAGSFTPPEAWNAAAGICRLGLEAEPDTAAAGVIESHDTWLAPASADDLPADRDLVALFEAGWRLLFEDVSMFVAGRLVAVLNAIRSADEEVQRDLERLRREMERQHRAGTPWLAIDALETLAMLDMPAWVALRGLLGECPVLPAALTAIVEGGKGAVSATAFECFAHRRQIDQVHAFAARLGRILC